VDAVAEEFLIEDDEAVIEGGGYGEEVVVDVAVGAEGVGAEVIGAGKKVAGRLDEIGDAKPCREGWRAGAPDGCEPAGAGVIVREEEGGIVDEAEARGYDGGGGVEIEAAEAGLDALRLVEVVGV
jgi:hypothetical protein